MVPLEKMVELAKRFDPPAQVIAAYRGVRSESEFRAGRESVLEMIRRRPCCVEDIAAGLDIHRNEAIKYVEELEGQGLAVRQICGGRLFYRGRCA
jgi:biotin operon repressor